MTGRSPQRSSLPNEPTTTSEARVRTRWYRNTEIVSRRVLRLIPAFLSLAIIGGAVAALWLLNITYARLDLLVDKGLWRLETAFGHVWLPRLHASVVIALAGAVGFIVWIQSRALNRAAISDPDQRTPRPRQGKALVWSFAVGACAVLLVFVLAEMTARSHFPMDLMIWAESSFVQDMLKLRQGLSTYSEASLNNSYVYNPGAPIITWAIASLFHRTDSLAFCRQLQIAFVVIACTLVWLASRRLADGDASTRSEERTRTPVFGLAMFAFLLAAALNPHTSPWVDLLHNDSLSILTSIAGLAALVYRHRWKNAHWLLLAAPLPALAIFVKQTGAVVGVGLVLGIWVQERRVLPALRFGILGALGVLLLLAGLAAWSDGWWFYWTVRVLAKQPLALNLGLRINGSVLLPLLPLCVVSLAWAIFGIPRLPERQRGVAWSASLYTLLLVGSASFTSFKVGTGAANHWGPAGLALACLTAAGCIQLVQSIEGHRAELWGNLAAGIAALVTLALLYGPPYEAARLVPGIEQRRYATRLAHEFHLADPAKTLLDQGSIFYLRRNVVPRDRCSTITETNVGKMRDVRATIDRVHAHDYDRILIHRVYGEKWYRADVMEAIRECYDLKGHIPGDESGRWAMMTEVLIFEPKANPANR